MGFILRTLDLDNIVPSRRQANVIYWEQVDKCYIDVHGLIERCIKLDFGVLVPTHMQPRKSNNKSGDMSSSSLGGDMHLCSRLLRSQAHIDLLCPIMSNWSQAEQNKLLIVQVRHTLSLAVILWPDFLDVLLPGCGGCAYVLSSFTVIKAYRCWSINFLSHQLGALVR